VQNGTTTTDCEPEAIKHVQSVCAGFAYATTGASDITIIDTPGFIDFFEETKLSLLAADGAVVVIDADPSRVAQTTAIIDHLELRALPHVFFINKLDRPGADFAGTLAKLRALYGPHCVATQLPIGSAESLRGYVDLAAATAAAYGPNGVEHTMPIPAELASAAESQRTILLEALADFDDHLMEELLDGVDPPFDEIARDLCADCTHDQIVAVLGGAAAVGAGVPALCAAIDALMPSPEITPRRDVDGREIVPVETGPVIAQVCKTIVHPQAGRYSVVRVFTGTLTPHTALVNASRDGAALKPSGLFRLFGKRTEPIASAGPGSIVAIGRLDMAATGETLSTPDNRAVMPSVPLATPVYAVAIKPREKLDESKLSAMLARILDEDPALRVARAEFTNELHLLGNGEMHVTTATERLTRKYNLALETHAPSVPYRETITVETEIHSRYKHQTGGHGQFADIWLRRVISRCDRRRRRAEAVLRGGRKGCARGASAWSGGRFSDDRYGDYALRWDLSRGRFERGGVQNGRRDGDPGRNRQVRPGPARTARAGRNSGAHRVRFRRRRAIDGQARANSRFRCDWSQRLRCRTRTGAAGGTRSLHYGIAHGDGRLRDVLLAPRAL
jgi:elongation factor G